MTTDAASPRPSLGGEEKRSVSTPSPPSTAPSSPRPLYQQLRDRLSAWRAAGASPQVLRWIREGARCEWTSGPPPPYNLGVSLAGPTDLSAQQSAWLENEISRCYATGALEDAPPEERSHVCRAHLVPKKTPPGEPQKWRLVIDLRPTNAYCREHRCRYETLRSLSRLARQGDWMVSFDLQDGYHQVGIFEEHRRYMTFALPPPPGSPPGAPPRYIRCAALPFGWSQSPLIFTKVMRVMVRLLRAPRAATLEVLRRQTARGRAATLRPAASSWAEALADHWRERLGDVAEADEIIGLLSSSLAPGTAESYGRHFARFIRWCAVQPDAPSPLPASTATVVRWLAADVVKEDRGPKPAALPVGPQSRSSRSRAP